MKKTLFALIGSLMLSSAAFAQTYHCDLLKDSDGNGIYGGPGYSVEVDGQTVILQVSSMLSHDGPVDYKMEKISQEPDAATFEAVGVTADIVTTAIGGFHGGQLFTWVSINKLIGDKSYTADCK